MKVRYGKSKVKSSIIKNMSEKEAHSIISDFIDARKEAYSIVSRKVPINKISFDDLNEISSSADIDGCEEDVLHNLKRISISLKHKFLNEE